MKLITFGLLIGATMNGQDARLITLVQEREARAKRLNERIEYQLSHPYNPAPVAAVDTPKTPHLNAADRDALRVALERLGACLTGNLVRNGQFYVPEVSEDCLAKR